jgi:S-layer like family, outer domain
VKKYLPVLIAVLMIFSSVGAASAINIYGVYGTTNSKSGGNGEDIVNSAIIFITIGATQKIVVKNALDTNLNPAVKKNSGNWIVLIGGPVANKLTKELVNAGKVKASLNGYQKVKNAYGANTANAIVIFGQNRQLSKVAYTLYANDLKAKKSTATFA